VPDFDHIFNYQADKYDRLVMAEDHRGTLVRTLNDLSVLRPDVTVADLGTGTGRVAFLVAPHVRHVYGVEPVAAMRKVAEDKAKNGRIPNVSFLEGEHKSIPLPGQSVDLIVEGWAFLRAYRVSYPEWRTEFAAIRREVHRVLGKSGPVVLIETMGSVSLWDQAPEGVRELYEYFEEEWGLSRRVIRTDYRFRSLAEAVDLGGFFFGEEMGETIRKLGDRIVPEATGIWYGQLKGGAE
jgi:ubiquinone/menaquinone biosynthesis C-methylase UbiE